MEEVKKQPPISFLEWTWNTVIQQSNKNQTPSQHDFDTPWHFKCMKTLEILSFNFFNSISSPSSNSHQFRFNFGVISPSNSIHVDAETNSSLNLKKMQSLRTGLNLEEQAEAEQRALALALGSGNEATILEFHSPNCSLCSSLLRFAIEVENQNFDWLYIVLADAEYDKWMLEPLFYDIKYVHCFVILDKEGDTPAKTDIPSSRLRVVAAVSHLFKLRFRNKVEYHIRTTQPQTLQTG